MILNEFLFVLLETEAEYKIELLTYRVTVIMQVDFIFICANAPYTSAVHCNGSASWDSKDSEMFLRFYKKKR